MNPLDRFAVEYPWFCGVFVPVALAAWALARAYEIARAFR